MKTIELNHPVHEVPAVAKVLGPYTQGDEDVGHELLFCDGHHANLTHEEIQELQAGLGTLKELTAVIRDITALIEVRLHTEEFPRLANRWVTGRAWPVLYRNEKERALYTARLNEEQERWPI